MARFKVVAVVALIISLALLHRLRANQKPDALQITYLGNEGFFVRSGSQAVLFDALFAGLPDYDHVPASTVYDMETGRPPFDNINAIFISHVHPDHFNLQSTIRFLKSHPSTVVVAPAEVSQQLRRALGDNHRTQLQIPTVFAERGRIITRVEGEIRFGIFPLPHGNVENLAYVVVLNGRKVLHLGDADLPMENLEQLKSFDHRTDLAFIPFWQLTENAQFVRDQIKAKVVVPMHLITHPTTADSKAYLAHIGGTSGILAKIHSAFPNAVLFRSPLETKTF